MEHKSLFSFYKFSVTVIAMAEKNNATCSICDKEYYKCLSCDDQMRISPWKQYTCTSEHYKIFQVVRGFNIGVYTKEEAKEKLQNVDLSDLNSLRSNIKKIIKEILKEDRKTASAVELEKTVSVIEDIAVAEDSVVHECQDTSRKKRYLKQQEQNV